MVILSPVAFRYKLLPERPLRACAVCRRPFTDDALAFFCALCGVDLHGRCGLTAEENAHILDPSIEDQDLRVRIFVCPGDRS
jgi:hypothetical protein